MPSFSAAWITVVPSDTSIFWPSISSVGMRARLLPGGPERTAAERRMLVELGPVLGDEGAHRHRGRVGQGADGVAHHVAGDVEQEIDVARRRPAMLELLEH